MKNIIKASRFIILNNEPIDDAIESPASFFPDRSTAACGAVL